jgi:hypothetical protein
MLEKMCEQLANGTYPNTVWDIGPKGDKIAPNHILAIAGNEVQILKGSGSKYEKVDSLTPTHLQKFEEILLDTSKSPSVYATIKNDPNWQVIYNYGIRPVTYMDKGGTIQTRLEATMPCRQCNLLLPFNQITIDHAYAQKSDPLDPIFKFFRAVGYTMQNPTGAKGREMVRSVSPLVGGGYKGSTGEYELSYAGMIVYSLFRNGPWYTNLKNLTLHNFVNLRPTCLICNSSKGKG